MVSGPSGLSKTVCYSSAGRKHHRVSGPTPEYAARRPRWDLRGCCGVGGAISPWQLFGVLKYNLHVSVFVFVFIILFRCTTMTTTIVVVITIFAVILMCVSIYIYMYNDNYMYVYMSCCSVCLFLYVCLFLCLYLCMDRTWALFVLRLVRSTSKHATLFQQHIAWI